jgi:hypothetical protein
MQMTRFSEGGLARYWTLSRSHTYSLGLALPLLLAYELLINLVNRLRPDQMQVRNLAESILQRMLMRAGVGGPSAFVGLLIVVAIGLIFLEWKDRSDLGWRSLEPRIFLAMLAESALWAWIFALVVSRGTAFLLSPFGALPAGSVGSARMASWTMLGDTIPPVPLAAGLSRLEGLALSLGAGLYEELLFRVILIGLILWLLTASGFTTRGPATLVAVLASALLFSLAHYVGPMGDDLQAASFIFRFLGGLAFSAIYALRGFGIAAWSHALYDVGLYLFMPPGG